MFPIIITKTKPTTISTERGENHQEKGNKRLQRTSTTFIWWICYKTSREQREYGTETVEYVGGNREGGADIQ